MATLRELERLARSLIAQKTDPEYITHYLVEVFQVDVAQARAVVDRLVPGRRPDPHGGGGKGRQPSETGIKKSRFY